jgi:monolysocardiolipin acyltransferase
MPENRSFPRFLPRLGARLSVTFGEPITDRLKSLVVDDPPPIPRPGPPASSSSPRSTPPRHQPTILAAADDPDTLQRPVPPDYSGDPAETVERRIKIARVLREEVDKLGRREAARKMLSLPP